MPMATAYDEVCVELVKHLGLKHVTKLVINIEANKIITVDATIEVQKDQLDKIIFELKKIRFKEVHEKEK